ncbi:hypothetical protein TNCV_1822241 [Trichonephila clavipes]|nr:hypothetical protein TNCV_1822241 [Trichonephila clavipes]
MGHDQATQERPVGHMRPAGHWLSITGLLLKISGVRAWLALSRVGAPVPLKTHRVGQRCTLNLSRAETSSRWCGVVVRREDASSGVVHVT